MCRITIFMGLALLCVLALENCTTTHKVTERSQLKNTEESGVLRVMTKDKTVYQISSYALRDSVLVCSGTKETGDDDIPFRGELQLSSIAFIQAQSSSFFKGLLVFSACAAFTAIAVGDLQAESHARVDAYTYLYNPNAPRIGGGSRGGGSCPYVYGWDGNRFRLEGEAFAIGWGKALESTTCTMMNTLKPEKGSLRIRLTNERPETHYFNSVRLVGVETAPDISVYADPEGELWPVREQVTHFRAVDNSGRDVSRDLIQRDGLYWHSDTTDFLMSSTFEDCIDLTVPAGLGKHGTSLILHAKNTHMAQSVFSALVGFLGDQTLAFHDAIENDTLMISLMKSWFEEASMKVSVWNGAAWQIIGRVEPEANMVQFSKLLRLPGDAGKGDTLKIRLTCLKDVWKIDALTFDNTLSTPLRSADVKCSSAIGPEGMDVRAVLAASDGQYARLLPPEQINLEFEVLTPPKGKKISYALYVRGYLYEWLPKAEPAAPANMFSNVSRAMRIPLLKSVLQNRQVLLPVIYADWKTQRATYEPKD